MSVTVVYRSAADMNRAEYWYEEGPKMRNRAIKAEAEVERLKLMVKSITGGLDECMETVHFLEAENAKLRAALSKVEDMCVSFHEDGPYQDNEEVRRIMEIYDIARSALEGGGADG